MSKGKKALFLTVFYLFFLLLFLLAAEKIVRMKGIRPWAVRNLQIKVEPGGKLFQTHPTLGYAHLPGQYRVTLKTGYSFNVTHLANSLRCTCSQENFEANETKEGIWIFGGSFTYGWSVNDEETYALLLQEHIPDYNVVNYGVNGYGTLHALLQFKEALTQMKPPKVAIIAYASMHDHRNTFLRSRRKLIAPWNKLGPVLQPYARLNKDGSIEISMAEVEYKAFPFMKKSAFVHFLEESYNKYEDNFYHSHDVTEAIILEIFKLAREHNVKLVVAGILQDNITADALEFARENGIDTIDISVDLTNDAYTNRPHDHHPSALAHKEYAEKLETYLRENILD